MRKMLFLLFFCPLLTSAQQDDWDIAYLKHRPDSLTQAIQMPERDYNPHYNYQGETNYKSRIRVVVIGTDSVYRKLFWRYTYTDDSLGKYKKEGVGDWLYKWMVRHHIDSLPTIDFSKYELLLYAACAQCLAYCRHGDSEGPCHRNACNYQESWFIREKKQAASTAPVIRKNLMDFYVQDKPDSSKKWVDLPDIFPSDLTKFFEVGQNSSYNYVVNTDSLYYLIFSHFPKDSLPVFDFAKQELVVYISCTQCGSSYKGNKKDRDDHLWNKPMHRNACRYYSWWYTRDKKNIRGSAGSVVE